MKLSDYAQGRDNNFNLIRLVAALAVLFSHCFALTSVGEEAEPFRRAFGVTAGTMAVDLFFVTSGFLVTGSLLARSSLVEFLWARVLRIYPALLVMLLLSVFVLGLCFTSLSATSYLGDARTWAYLVKNSILARGVAFSLPGVFEGNPYPNAVNGSLWTLPLELEMYGLLAVAWAVSRAAWRFRSLAFKVAVFACAGGGFVWHVATHFSSEPESSSTRLFFMFFSGATCFLLKGRIRLSRPVFWLLLLALSLSALERHVLFVVYDLAIAYVLFYLAFVPAGRIRTFNRLGDYSYGVYIYAFPVQQSIAAQAPGISVASLFVLASAVTLFLAALSWHGVERHALGLRRTCVDSTRRLLSRIRSRPAA